MATAVFTCPLCGALSLTLKAYVSHLRVIHGRDSSFNVMCEINDCREVFRAFAAFNSHVYRHHRPALGLDSDGMVMQHSETECSANHEELSLAEPQVTEDEVATTSATTLDGDLRLASGTFTDVEHVTPGGSGSNWRCYTAAKFLLQLREGRQISQVAVSDVIDGSRTLCKQTGLELKQRVQLSLASAGIDVQDIPGMADVFNQVPDPFEGVDTNHLHEKFCIDEFGCVVST